jgi:hypothetical protein
MGNVLNGRLHIKNYAIPLDHLSQAQYDLVRSIHINDSISALEALTKNEKLNNLQLSVPTSVKTALENSIQSLGNPYFQIISIHQTISVSLFTNILSSVRSKLLDFMIVLEKEFGEETSIETLKQKNPIINTFINTTIYNNGDGNITNTGKKANINTTSGTKKS